MVCKTFGKVVEFHFGRTVEALCCSSQASVIDLPSVLSRDDNSRDGCHRRRRIEERSAELLQTGERTSICPKSTVLIGVMTNPMMPLYSAGTTNSVILHMAHIFAVYISPPEIKSGFCWLHCGANSSDSHFHIWITLS